VEIFEDGGLEAVFGFPCEQMDPYYSSLSESSVSHVLARSEASAALMADGYARASRKVGVVDGVGGPGAAYIRAGLCEAQDASSPVVALIGDNEREIRGKEVIQDADNEAVLEPHTTRTFDPESGGAYLSPYSTERLSTVSRFTSNPMRSMSSRGLRSKYACRRSVDSSGFRLKQFPRRRALDTRREARQAVRPVLAVKAERLLLDAFAHLSRCFESLLRGVVTQNLDDVAVYRGVCEVEKNDAFGMLGSSATSPAVSDDVLVPITAPSSRTSSSDAATSRLSSRFSGTASTTKSAPSSAEMSVSYVTLSAVDSSFAMPASRSSSSNLDSWKTRASSRASGSTSTRTTEQPAFRACPRCPCPSVPRPRHPSFVFPYSFLCLW